MLITALVFSSAAHVFASETEQNAQGIALDETTAAAFLDAFFSSDTVSRFHIGAAVTIVKGGEILAQQGFGYADIADQTAVDPEHTLFRIASVSKTFTAVAVMQLVEQGKIDLHEDILTYLPGLNLVNPFDKPVTVADLLTHRSGLEVRDPETSDIHTDFDYYISIEDYVAERLPPVVREPGTAYMYDNFGYLLLGLLVQEVSGEPYEEYMAKHVFEPLGMESTGYLLTDEALERLVTGYDLSFQPVEPYVINPTVMPHGGMLSTAEDMGKFMIAFLNGGALDPDDENTRILSEQSVEEMTVYRSFIHPLLPNTTYGFEAYIQFPMAGVSEAILTKAGDVPGNSSMLLLLPEERVGVFMTFNTQTGLRDLFYLDFLNTFFPQYVQPVELEAFEPYPPEQLAGLSGYYTDLRLSGIVYKVDVAGDGTLVITDAKLGPRQLTQVGDRLFIDQIASYFTAFHLDESSGRFYMKEPYVNPLGYARQGEIPQGFADIAPDNAYAPFIYALQSIGIYPNDASQNFAPEEGITRAELVYDLLRISGVKAPEPDQYSFQDIAGHPLAAYVQFAHDMGMVKGDGTGNFLPDRLATRQEVAAMIWQVYSALYPTELFADVPLAGEVASWANNAVKMMVTFGYHGPELAWTENGADFQAQKTLTRQEAAAIYHQLMLQPADVIIAQLMQQQAQAANP